MYFVLEFNLTNESLKYLNECDLDKIFKNDLGNKAKFRAAMQEWREKNLNLTTESTGSKKSTRNAKNIQQPDTQAQAIDVDTQRENDNFVSYL